MDKPLFRMDKTGNLQKRRNNLQTRAEDHCHRSSRSWADWWLGFQIQPVADSSTLYIDHFNSSATFEMPDITQASSLSPPTAPLTPMAPNVSLPTLIGTPPATPAVPSMLGIGDPKIDPQAFAASPDVFHREANVSAV